MTRAALVKLLIAQSVLLVLLLWAGAWLGRDEFLLATETPVDEQIDTAPSPLARAGQGVPAVRLTRKAQRQVGIEVAAPDEVELAEARRLPGTVLDVQPLAELRGRLRAARHEAEAARAAAAASAAEQRRVQGLYDDDRNASQRALEVATAQAAADAARERAAAAALAALRDAARAGWGERIAGWLDAPGAGPLDRLVSGRDALVRVSTSPEAPLPADAKLQFLPAGADAPRPALPLGNGPAGDVAGPGRLYVLAAAGLAAGQRITLDTVGGVTEAGVLVPATAIVWHAGQPWVYVRESSRDEDDDRPAAAAAAAASAVAEREPEADAFERRAVPHARRQGERWFLPAFLEDDPVVVQGAQVLLSEELKYQIRDENDD